MPEDTPPLLRTAAAVTVLGSSQADIDLLDDAALQAGMRAIADHDRELQKYRLWLAAAIARRCNHTLGYQGLARKQGFPTPATLIQSLTGSTLDDANRLARMGAMVIQAETDTTTLALDAGPDETGQHETDSGGVNLSGGSGDTAITLAAQSGGITLACADAIRKGLGTPDTAVTADQLRVAAEKLITHTQQQPLTGPVTPETLLKLARHARAELDATAIERGEKQRYDDRYLRTWERDGFVGGSWRMPADGPALQLNTLLKLALAHRTGGPRFPNTDSNGNPIPKTPAEQALEDDRTPEQVLADTFEHIVESGMRENPALVPGASRAAVRVIVTEQTLTNTRTGTRTGTALLEENLTPISLNTLDQYLCNTGTIGILFTPDGTIDVGREQRLFTRKQRTALGVRDGGCRYPSCTKPPSWCEAHHINHWWRDHGRTDTSNGILLCRYHHQHIHNNGWEIIHHNNTYWLKPPAELDPTQTLIEMPTKNPLIAALKHTQHAS